jgi:signal transduction histidine kinase
LIAGDEALENIFPGGSSMSIAMRSFDWTATSLGAPDDWPQALKTLVNVLLAASQPMFLAWGADRVWLYNDAFTPILGDKHPGALGLPGMAVWAEAKDELESLFARVFAGEAVYRADLGLMLDRHGSLEEAHFAFSYTPARDEHGRIAGLFGTCIETTAQVLATRALAELNSTLEQQVEERTAKLMAAEESLRQSQKMEAVGQLTGGIAHDFNNLLMGITGNLELLTARLEQGRIDAIPRHIDMAQSAARRLTALTQRLLAFSRLQTLDPHPTNINRLIGEMEDLIRRTVGPAAEIEVVNAGGLWLTLVDQNQLETALLNLCINARDAMPDGGRLTIETANKWLDDRAARQHDLSPGQYVSLCVSDTGTGMSAEIIARAFDPFFTTKPLGQGTGLGLSMVHGFARQSDGQVRIYSEPGRGTTMCIYLPRYVGTETATVIADGRMTTDYDGHGEVVLVVDDEPAVRMLIVEVLEDAGYGAIEAVDGPGALKVLQSAAPIDLLITDVGLPGGMNGRQIADVGRALRPDLKILFITGYAENAAVGNGYLDPGMQIITKPFPVDVLGDKIRQMLDG